MRLNISTWYVLLPKYRLRNLISVITTLHSVCLLWAFLSVISKTWFASKWLTTTGTPENSLLSMALDMSCVLVAGDVFSAFRALLFGALAMGYHMQGEATFVLKFLLAFEGPFLKSNQTLYSFVIALHLCCIWYTLVRLFTPCNKIFTPKFVYHCWSLHYCEPQQKSETLCFDVPI